MVKIIQSGFDFGLTYYVSGPMAGYPEHNFPAFEAAEGMLTEAGIKVLSAHKIKHLSPEEFKMIYGREIDWHDYLRVDLLHMMQKTRGIILLKGWPQSRGAQLELHLAMQLKYPVWTLDSDTRTLMNMNGVSHG